MTVPSAPNNDDLDEMLADYEPTAEDQAVWTAVYGFTPQEIGVMARYLEVPEETVTRLIELARFIRTLPMPEVQS